MFEGQCHCGNVQLIIPRLPETANRCTCSICARYGALWSHFTEAEVTVTVGAKGLHAYCHGDKLINFNRCGECGCITHYTSTTPSPDTRLSVNFRMFAPALLDTIRIRTFDGADTWEFLD